MSIWVEEGRIHVGIMVKGKRIHRRFPETPAKEFAKPSRLLSSTH